MAKEEAIGPMVISLLLVTQMGQMADGTFNALPLSEFQLPLNVCICVWCMACMCLCLCVWFYFSAPLGNSYSTPYSPE